MRRRLLFLLALAGLAWLWLRRGGRRPESVIDVPPAGDPAGELRRKLEETKERAEEASATAGEEVDARRREVHDRARSAADEMRRSTSD